MRVIRNPDDLRERTPRSAVTIGNFDGVHLAHQKLIRRVVECARAASATSAAITFDPHPASILAPERAPRLLTPFDRKLKLIEMLGVELVFVLPFTRDLSRLSPGEFVRKILVEKMRPRSVHVGPNFRFGHGQEGNTQVLAELARKEGFNVEVMPMLEVRGDRVSSSRIRELLSEGRVEQAGRLLGRPFSNCGAIVPGIGAGRRQTVPTLNLAPVEEQLPRVGVYVTRTRVGATVHESVSNVGHKPTFGDHPLTVESFLLNFSREISEGEMEVEYLHRLRDEMKFPSPAVLKAQIQEDATRSLKFFRLLKLVQERGAKRLA